MDLRSIIKKELQRQGVAQARLAELADMTPARVSQFLTGKRDVNAETLRRMLEALKLEIRPAKGRRKGR